jgi:ATP-binding cassette, subfamily B, bacterial
MEASDMSVMVARSPAAPARLPSQAMAIHLRDVSYTYPQSGKIALQAIDCTFRAGTTAVVGPNGAGKSTLVKLLTGLLAPTSGSIRVHLPSGVAVPPEGMRKAVLFQEPSHLYLTIRQNVTMRFDRTPNEDARIYDALEIAGLAHTVSKLPDGIDTLVGAGFGGQVDLSGGQWQRLGLARLIYQDALVMILDEPIASLDPEGERAVFELFSQHMQGKVIIFTTHRYDSIPTNTKIVVLVDGRITETGTHEELFERQRDYWSLYTATRPTAHTSSRPAQEIVRGQPRRPTTRWLNRYGWTSAKQSARQEPRSRRSSHRRLPGGTGVR